MFSPLELHIYDKIVNNFITYVKKSEMIWKCSSKTWGFKKLSKLISRRIFVIFLYLIISEAAIGGVL